MGLNIDVDGHVMPKLRVQSRSLVITEFDKQVDAVCASIQQDP